MPVYHERYNQLTKEDFVYVARERGTLKDAGVHNQHDIYPFPCRIILPSWKKSR